VSLIHTIDHYNDSTRKVVCLFTSRCWVTAASTAAQDWQLTADSDWLSYIASARPKRKYRFQQFLQCCMCIYFHGNVFIVPLPNNGRLFVFHYSGFQPSCHNSSTPYINIKTIIYGTDWDYRGHWPRQKNSKVHYRVHKSPILWLILNEINSLHNFTPYLFKVHYIIIF
jgi:hypothetical protein